MSAKTITEQSAKKFRMMADVTKHLLYLRHRLGETTSCKGQPTAQFQLVNSGKILSKDVRRVAIPVTIGRGLLFLHFSIRFTRAIQRSEESGGTPFFMSFCQSINKPERE